MNKFLTSCANSNLDSKLHFSVTIFVWVLAILYYHIYLSITLKRFLSISFILGMLLLQFPFAGYGQKGKDTTTRKQLDSIYLKRENYVLSARTKLTIFVFSSRFLNGLLFTNPGTNSYYFPITPVNIGLGFSHKWLAVNIALVTPKIGKNHYDGQGTKYKNFNFQVLAYTHKYGMDVLYSQNIGYFLGNYNNYISVTNSPDKAPYFDMKTQRFTLNTLRIFNSQRYSMNAPMIGGEMQKNNAKSFILNGVFSLSAFHMSDSIPEFLLAQMNQDAIFKNGTFYSIGILPGYGFTWIIKKRFYVGIIPAVGPSFQYKSMSFEGRHQDQFSVSYRVLAKAGAGFHAKRWTAGISILFDSEQYHLADQTNIINNNGKLTLRVGYKINVPKWGKKTSEKMSNMQNKVEDTLQHF